MRRFKVKPCSHVYKQKEKLKEWGWFWNPQRRHWEIEALDTNQPEITVLKRLGLLFEEI